MSKFAYPKLPRNEIVATLVQYQIANVSEADLDRRDSDLVCHLYEQVVSRLTQESLEEGQMEFGALEQLENPEHHATSIRKMDIFRKIQHILTAVKCPKAFNLKDIVKPEPDRTVLFLGVLLNFFLYREQKLDIYQPIYDDIDLLNEQKSATEAGISQLNAEIAEIEESRESELPVVQELKFEIQKLQQTVAELNKHQAALKATINKSKEKAKEINEKISDADFSLQQTETEHNSLRSKIVQSPDKLQSALEEKKSIQAETKIAERAARQSFQEKNATLEAYTKACKKMTKYLEQLNAIQEQVNNVKSVEKDVKMLKAKISDEGVSINSLDVKHNELQSKADKLKEHEKQLEKDIAAKNEAASKELNSVRLEIEIKRCELELRQKQVESVVAEADAMTLKKRIVKEEGEAKMQELLGKAKQIMEEFYNYSKRISDLLPATEEVSQEKN